MFSAIVERDELGEAKCDLVRHADCAGKTVKSLRTSAQSSVNLTINLYWNSNVLSYSSLNTGSVP